MSVTEHNPNHDNTEQRGVSVTADVLSEDAYVRRMRPTFGYAMALSWVMQMTAITWAIVVNPAQAGPIILAVADLTFMWAIALSVVGAYFVGRSKEKGAGDFLAGRFPFLPFPHSTGGSEAGRETADRKIATPAD